MDTVGSYGLLNLYAGVCHPDGPWELTVFGKNITGEREILSPGNSTASLSLLGGAAFQENRVGAFG
jgi:hypothetical protein